MRLPWVFALYCAAVVGAFTLARTEGWTLFGRGTGTASTGTSGTGTGGHSGIYLGSHK